MTHIFVSSNFTIKATARDRKRRKESFARQLHVHFHADQRQFRRGGCFETGAKDNVRDAWPINLGKS